MGRDGGNSAAQWRNVGCSTAARCDVSRRVPRAEPVLGQTLAGRDREGSAGAAAFGYRQEVVVGAVTTMLRRKHARLWARSRRARDAARALECGGKGAMASRIGLVPGRHEIVLLRDCMSLGGGSRMPRGGRRGAPSYAASPTLRSAPNGLQQLEPCGGGAVLRRGTSLHVRGTKRVSGPSGSPTPPVCRPQGPSKPSPSSHASHLVDIDGATGEESEGATFGVRVCCKRCCIGARPPRRNRGRGRRAVAGVAECLQRALAAVGRRAAARLPPLEPDQHGIQRMICWVRWRLHHRMGRHRMRCVATVPRRRGEAGAGQRCPVETRGPSSRQVGQ